MKSITTSTAIAAMVLMVLAASGSAAPMPAALGPVISSFVERSFSVALAVTNQTITFAKVRNKTFGAAPFTVTAAASSGLPVGFTSTTTAVCTAAGAVVTFVKTGTCTIRAAQAGNANYNAATNVNQSFTIAKGNQTISFVPPSDKAIGAPPFAVTATATSGLAVTFSSLTPAVCTVSGATITILTLGTCALRAMQSGNANYSAAPTVDRSFPVASNANVTIQYTYDAIGNLIGVQRAQ